MCNTFKTCKSSSSNWSVLNSRTKHNNGGDKNVIVAWIEENLACKCASNFFRSKAALQKKASVGQELIKAAGILFIQNFFRKPWIHPAEHQGCLDSRESGGERPEGKLSGRIKSCWSLSTKGFCPERKQLTSHRETTEVGDTTVKSGRKVSTWFAFKSNFIITKWTFSLSI